MLLSILLLSYMTNDYIINVHYKLEFRYIQNALFHRQYQVLHHTWSDDLLTYKEISHSIPGALLGDFVRFKGLNNTCDAMTFKSKCNF